MTDAPEQFRVTRDHPKGEAPIPSNPTPWRTQAEHQIHWLHEVRKYPKSELHLERRSVSYGEWEPVK
jgi:hypothetical protein